MKYLKYSLVIGILALIFSSCYDEKMEWVDKENDLTVADLPLPLQEKITRYDALKTYLAGQFPNDFKWGIGVNLDEFVSNDEIFDLVRDNFNDIAIGYDMKHGAVMGSDGNIKTAGLDRLFAKLQGTGISLYGHTLVWHQNQNASYLNGLLAPTILPPEEPGGNLLDVSGLEDGSFDNWSKLNNSDGITIVEGAGINGGPALRFEVTSAGNEWDTQLSSPEIPVTEGAEIQFNFNIRSEEAGNFRISFSGMSNSYPWYGGGALISTSSDWTYISYGAETTTGIMTATASLAKMIFDMGKTAGVYYVDINSLKVIDPNAESDVNYVINGGFEEGMDNWELLNPGQGIEAVDTEVYSGSYSAQMIAGTGTNAWDLQMQSAEIILEAGQAYTFSFMIKSDAPGKGRVSLPGYSNQYPWMDWQGKGAQEAFTTSGEDWEYIGVELNGGDNGYTIKLCFDIGYMPGVTYWLDDVKVTPKETAAAPALRAGPTIIEKTPEEKKEIISTAMKNWIFDMVGYCKDYVYAWDVLNEPMKPGGGTTPRDASTQYENDDEFNYPLYMGDDYSAKAFIWAREADPNAVLFINEYNLESSIPRLEGYLEYVKTIEAMTINETEFAGKKAKIDGIGTQMHVTYNADNIDNIKADIKTMFEKLAASGKKIKITELDIALGTASPTSDQLLGQADLYQYIIDTYKAIIPQSQQFGITIWGVYDTTEGNWLPNESPCLWDANGNRKVAYKGVADGLAGRDVSEEFSGELIY